MAQDCASNKGRAMEKDSADHKHLKGVHKQVMDALLLYQDVAERFNAPILLVYKDMGEVSNLVTMIEDYLVTNSEYR